MAEPLGIPVKPLTCSARCLSTFCALLWAGLWWASAVPCEGSAGEGLDEVKTALRIKYYVAAVSLLRPLAHKATRTPSVNWRRCTARVAGLPRTTRRRSSGTGVRPGRDIPRLRTTWG